VITIQKYNKVVKPRLMLVSNACLVALLRDVQIGMGLVKKSFK